MFDHAQPSLAEAQTVQYFGWGEGVGREHRHSVTLHRARAMTASVGGSGLTIQSPKHPDKKIVDLLANTGCLGLSVSCDIQG